jgi:excisionase family DNA binding protein
MLTVKQVAEQLGVSAGLVYSLCSLGVLRHSRHGRPHRRGCIRISEDAVAEYLRAKEVGPAVARPVSPTRPKVKLENLRLTPS